MKEQIRNGQKMTDQKKWSRQKRMLMMMSMTLLLCGQGIVVSANYAQNASTWVFDQLFWVALIVFIGVIVMFAAKKNVAGAITSFIVGAIVVYLIKNPTKLEEVGNSIMNTVMQ